MVIEQREKKYNLDKISNSLFSQQTSHVNEICPKTDEDKERIFHNKNIICENSYNVSDNNLFNESDRKKLIMTNDHSQIEGNNKSSNLFQNLINIDNLKKELNEKNLENHSFENHNTHEPKKSNTIVEKEKVGPKNDGKSMKSKKDNQDIKLKNEKNIKELLDENKIKQENLNKKSFVGTDEEIIMDFDMEVIISEEDDKRKRKVRFLENIENLSKALEHKNKNGKYENLEKINFKKNTEEGLYRRNIEIEDEIEKVEKNLIQIKEEEFIKSKGTTQIQNENSKIISKKVTYPSELNLNKIESFSRKRRSNLRIKKVKINKTPDNLNTIDLNNNLDSCNINSIQTFPKEIIADNGNLEFKAERENISHVQNESKNEISLEKIIN